MATQWKVNFQSEISAMLMMLKKKTHNLGNGLFLRTTPNGTGSYQFKKMVDGNTTRFSIGNAKDITLKQAQKIATETAKKLDSGIPLYDRIDITYETCFEDFIRKNKIGWKDSVARKLPREQAKMESVHRCHILPVIGQLPPNSVGKKEFQMILEPIWESNPHTAKKCRQYMSRILRHAKVNEWMDEDAFIYDDAKYWASKLGKQDLKNKRRPTLDFHYVNQFWSELQKEPNTISKLALQMTILTSARIIEIRQMKFSQLKAYKLTSNAKQKYLFWNVTDDMSKNSQGYKVPFTDEMEKIFIECKKFQIDNNCKSDFVFFNPDSRNNPFISENCVTERIKQMHISKLTENKKGWIDNDSGERITGHGFRSTFRSYIGENTGYPDHVLEACINHIPEGMKGVYDAAHHLANKSDIFTNYQSYVTGKKVKHLSR